MDDYRFKDKDPIIDVMRTLVQTYATIEGIRFGQAMTRIEHESNYAIKAPTLRNWFLGPTRFPQYHHVARLTLFLKGYARKPVEIGDRTVSVIRVVSKRSA